MKSKIPNKIPINPETFAVFSGSVIKAAKLNFSGPFDVIVMCAMPTDDGNDTGLAVGCSLPPDVLARLLRAFLANYDRGQASQAILTVSVDDGEPGEDDDTVRH